MLTKENLEKIIFKEKEEKLSQKAKKEKEYKINCISTFLGYATQKYKCKFSENFAEELYEMAFEKRIPNVKVIDTIIAEWNIWKPYVLEQSFNSFVKCEIEGVFKKQVSTTFSAKSLRGYIGNKAIVVKEPPKGLTTSIFAIGKLHKNGVDIPIFEEK